MVWNRILGVLVGRDRTLTHRLSMLAFGIFLVTAGIAFVMRVTGIDAPLLWLTTGYNAIFLAILVTLLAGMSAYLNDGLLVSCALAFAPVFALFLNYVGVGFIRKPTTMEFIGLAAAFGLLYTVPLGTLGFLLGTGIRRISEFVK